MREKAGIRQIVLERMEILLSLAENALRQGNVKRAKRYIFIARKLSTRYNCRFSRQQRMRFCKLCGMPNIAGLNCTVRLRKRSRTVEYACSCGGKRAFKY